MVASAAAFCVALLLVSLPDAHPTPVPQPGASPCLVRLLPCLPFVGGNVAVPSDTCCANLGSMVHDEPLCLCQALSQSGSGVPPFAVNMTRVLELPHLCRLDLPAATAACAGLLRPVGPASSPPVNSPRPSANSTVPSTQMPVIPTPPLTTVSPGTSSQLPGYSGGSKLIVGGISVALGFMALAPALAF